MSWQTIWHRCTCCDCAVHFFI